MVSSRQGGDATAVLEDDGREGPQGKLEDCSPSCWIRVPRHVLNAGCENVLLLTRGPIATMNDNRLHNLSSLKVCIERAPHCFTGLRCFEEFLIRPADFLKTSLMEVWN